MKRNLFILLSLFCLLGCKEKALDLEKPVYVTIETNKGDVTVMLYNDTPLHRDNFIRLCQSGQYEGLLFHRIIKDFVVQGGDPLSKERKPDVLYGDGDGGYTVPAEILPHHFNKRGALIDAKESDDVNPERASAGTQFCFVQGKKHTDEELLQREARINEIRRNGLFYTFRKQMLTENPSAAEDSLQLINLELQALLQVEDSLEVLGYYTIPEDRKQYYKTVGGVPHLDGSVTIFGEVVEGFDIVEKMSLVKTDKNDRPLQDVYIKSTEVFQK